MQKLFVRDIIRDAPPRQLPEVGSSRAELIQGGHEEGKMKILRTAMARIQTAEIIPW